MSYDALLVVSFGGPEQRDDVMPFLENVTRGRNVPRERLEEVAQHYDHFGGVSPINAQNRELVSKLKTAFVNHGLSMPIYWGNRNWHPFLVDALREMKRDGVRNALAWVTSAFGSYSGCRQYLENIEAARLEINDAPVVHKVRSFHNHPLFIESVADHAKEALLRLGTHASRTQFVFTAHSIPRAMADACRYEQELKNACGFVMERLGDFSWSLAFQSRSGPPTQPWLEPDILDELRSLKEHGIYEVVVVPIGFVSDHMEVLWDLDTEAKEFAAQIGVHMERASTAGTHPAFGSMIRELVMERLDPGRERRFLGSEGPAPDFCAPECCVPLRRSP